MRKLFMVLLICFALLSCQSREPEGRAVVGKKAPGFTLKDLNGTRVSLSDYSGKVVLLEFWATWCPPCRESLPELMELHEKYNNKDVVLLAISVDEGRDVARTVSDFAVEYGITYQILFSDELTTRLYAIWNIPVMFVLDRQHIIYKKYLGYIPGFVEEISKEIDGLL